MANQIKVLRHPSRQPIRIQYGGISAMVEDPSRLSASLALL